MPAFPTLARPRAALAALAAIVALGACDETDVPPAEDGQLADSSVPDSATAAATDAATTPPDASPEVADGPPARVRLVPFEIVSGDPVVGAEVCTTADPPECATTTIEGASVEVPERVNTYLTVTAPDYVDTLYPVPGSTGDAAWVFPIVLESVADVVTEQARIDREPGGATIFAAASAGGSVGDDYLPGLAFTIDGPGDGPYYLTEQNTLSRDDNATSARGAAVFMNVFADAAVVRVFAPDHDCVVNGPGWPLSDDEPTAARVALRPDAITHVQYTCTARK